MVLCWNSRDILNLNTELDSFTCLASEHIHELRQRCSNTIDPEDYDAVHRILHTIDTSPNPEVIFHKLGRLSSLTLCKYHQNNDSKQSPAPSSEIYSQWKTLFQERWRKDKREELRRNTESYNINNMKQQLEQIKLCFDEEEDDQMFYSSPLLTTPRYQVSTPSSPPSSNAVSPTDDSFLRPNVPTIRRNTFGNDAGSSPFENPQDPLPTYLRESNLDIRPSLRILVRSVLLLPSPPQTPELPGESAMEDESVYYSRRFSSTGSYYSESSSSSPSSPHPKPLRINSRNNNRNMDGNDFLFPTELAPRIPPKSPLRPKSSNFNTKFPIIKRTFISLPSPTKLSEDQHSPISPLSSHHSKNSSCSSTNTDTSFLPSRSSFNSLTSFSPPQPTNFSPITILSPFPFSPSGRETAQKTNSGTPRIRAPTPTSPTFTKRPKFLIQDEYAEESSSIHQEEEEQKEDNAADYFSASLNLNPVNAVNNETLQLWKGSTSTPPIFPTQIPPKNIRRRTANFVDFQNKDEIPRRRTRSRDEGKRVSKYTFTPSIPSPLKDKFESSLFCSVCRLARGEGTCGCLDLTTKSNVSVHTAYTTAASTLPSSEKVGSEWRLAGGKDVCRGVKKLVKGVVGRLVGKDVKRRNTTGGVVGGCEKGFVGGAAIRRESK